MIKCRLSFLRFQGVHPRVKVLPFGHASDPLPGRLLPVNHRSSRLPLQKHPASGHSIRSLNANFLRTCTSYNCDMTVSVRFPFSTTARVLIGGGRLSAQFFRFSGSAKRAH